MQGNRSDGMRAMSGFWVFLSGNVRMNGAKTTMLDRAGSRSELTLRVHFRRIVVLKTIRDLGL